MYTMLAILFFVILFVENVYFPRISKANDKVLLWYGNVNRKFIILFTINE